MSGRIPREFIDDLLVRVDIVDLIDSYVPLKKAGTSHKARCPFHDEKSPSFSVNRKKQFYHCFGCGAGGNALSFLMEFNHLDFVEAVEDLAGFVGIDVPRETGQYQNQRRDYSALYLILEQVAVFYVEQLRQHEQAGKAVEYLKSRGLSGDVAKNFSLGYAPDDWNSLASRFDNTLLIDAGMLVKKEDGRVYDRFRGRLVFPIRDKRKRIIGFGGRVLDDTLPKYLNSPETEVFSKGKELYGLFELLESDSKPARILIVEGYMDVLALNQFGVTYSVAALGTATSKNHLDLLFRFTAELVFCFDGDEAGTKAAWRAVQESFPCLRDGRQVKVMMLPIGQDPDSLVRNEGVDEFEKRIQNSQPLSDYFFQTLSKELDLSSVEGKAQLVSAAKPFIEKIPAGIFREMMLDELGKETSTPSLPDLKMGATASTIKQSAVGHEIVITPERALLALLLQNPELAQLLEEHELNWDKLSFSSKDWLLDILQTIESDRPENTGRLLEIYRGNEQKEKMLFKLANLEVFPRDNEEFDDKAAFKGALLRVVELGRKQYFNEMLDEQTRKQ